MTVQSSQETDLPKTLADYRSTHEAHAAAKEHLSQALGALVGSRINITGYPTSAVVASSVDDEGMVLRRTAVPKYRSLLLEEDQALRKPVSLSGQQVLAMSRDELHVSAAADKISKEQFEVIGYIFRLHGITAIEHIANIDK